MMEKPEGFIICRRGSDPLKPGYRLGYECAICKKELQVSPSAIAAMEKQRLLTLCNPCGFAMQKRLHEAGANMEEIYSADFMRSFADLMKGKSE